ncbi:MAG: hypothetical protein Q7T55_11410 [Solirubrobacteraceae bacterium]|nr:hypothetical protein [Solirubrobacteraceae bacterium]
MQALHDAASQSWPPFVLVAGLLLIGGVAHAANLFERAGTILGRLPGPPTALLFACMLLVAGVTAVMNLDTAVVFLTPVLVIVARQRDVDERPFLYAALFLANASSLFLPGANLTNLLVLGHGSIGGAAFAKEMFAPAVTATLVTAIGVWAFLGPRRGRGSTAASATDADPSADATDRSPTPGVPPALQPGARAATVGVIVAGALTVGLPEPALPVLATGLVAGAVACVLRTTTPRQLVAVVGPPVLGLLFALSVALGVLARTWDGPSTLLADAGRWETVGIAAVASIALNNLPAATLLSAEPVVHARALLIGLNLGPNLAVTGSLSSYLWYRSAKQIGAAPSIATVSRLGIVLGPAAIVAATLSLALGGSL